MGKKLGFGMMRLPMKGSEVDYEELNKMVDTYLERGFTYFDTALMYCDGKSEEAVKKAIIERHPRDKYTIATKLHAGFFKNKEERDNVFKGQLEKTGAGYFDYYLIHDVNSHSYPHYVENDCFNWLREQKEKGLVKTMGFSFHDGPEFLDKVLTEHPEMEFVQLQINYLDWESMGVQSRKCYEVAEKHGKKVIVMEPVKGGTLANIPSSAEAMFKARDSKASVPSWAIRFAASLPNVMMVLSGMSNLSQLIDNTDYMQDFKPLTEDEKQMVLKAADIINGNITIPCTGCSYCTGGCPKNIAIPQFFSLYNADMQECKEKGWTPQGEYYINLTKTNPKASECIKCGKCEKICPQSLPIRKYLEDVAKHFEG